MQKLLVLVLATLFIYPNVSFGCSCLAPSSFCESIIGADNELRPDIIVRGKYKKGGNQGNDIKINQVIYGVTSENKILLKYGFCDIYTQELKNGDEYIFALRKFEEDYFLLACAVSFLKIENGHVIGKIAPGVDKLSYSAFLNFKSCGGDRLKTLSNLVSVFPNPTSEVLNIKNNSAEKELKDFSIDVFDILGRSVINDIKVEGILPEEVMTVNVSDLSTGVYIVRVYDRFSERVERIVKL